MRRRLPTGEPNGVKTEVLPFGRATPRCTTEERGAAGTPALSKPSKEEAFSDLHGVYDECRMDGVFCSNAMQIP